MSVAPAESNNSGDSVGRGRKTGPLPVAAQIGARSFDLSYTLWLLVLLRFGPTRALGCCNTGAAFRAHLMFLFLGSSSFLGFRRRCRRGASQHFPDGGYFCLNLLHLVLVTNQSCLKRRFIQTIRHITTIIGRDHR